MKPLTLAVASAIMLFAGGIVSGQLLYTSGQNVAPVFEGWERNADGSFNMLFGYFNPAIAEEVVEAPVGADNKFEPGDADRGQPTHFYPFRNRYWFRVRCTGGFRLERSSRGDADVARQDRAGICDAQSQLRQRSVDSSSSTSRASTCGGPRTA